MVGAGRQPPGVVARRVVAVAVDRSPEVDVEEEPQQMGPEERLFRARQSWPVYAIFAFSVIVAVTLILASR
jgi:hypothetical protein